MNRRLEVVVVDDEQQITDLFKTFLFLADQEISVHTFNDSIAAKDFIAKNPVDVLITDLNMPLFSGLNLMESAPKETRKILMSGYVGDIPQVKLRELNATFFEKPVPLAEVIQIVSEQKKLRLQTKPG